MHIPKHGNWSDKVASQWKKLVPVSNKNHIYNRWIRSLHLNISESTFVSRINNNNVIYIAYGACLTLSLSFIFIKNLLSIVSSKMLSSCCKTRIYHPWQFIKDMYHYFYINTTDNAQKVIKKTTNIFILIPITNILQY